MTAPPSPPIASDPKASARARLDRSLVHGIAWTGGMKWATQLLSWVTTLVVARLVKPSDYGLAAMALVYIGFVQLVNEFGLSAAVVQRRDLTDGQIARLGGLSVLLGAFFSLVSLALAAPVAAFFGEPALRPVIMVLSVTFVASAFQVLPRSLLTRDLDFRKLAGLEGFEAVTLTVTTLALALAGLGYWALVLGGVVSRLAATAAALAVRRHRHAWPTPLRTIADPVTFGAHIVAANVAWYAFRNADLTVIGRVLGGAALGAYTFGWNLASIPVDRVSALLARATPAVLASVQRDAPALRRYVLGLTEAITLATFPAALGLAIVADDFVLVFLGESWRAAIVPLRLLSLAAVFRSLIPVLNQALVATGGSKRNMHATIATALVLPGLFVVGSRWGTAGVALVWVIFYPIVTSAFLVRYALRACHTSAAAYLRSLWPAASASLVMVAAVVLVGRALPAPWPPAALLAVQAAVGALVYAGVVYYAHRERVRAIMGVLRAARREPAAEN